MIATRWSIPIVCALALMCAAGSAGAERRRPRKAPLNMPTGWVWPPSAEMRRAGARCLERLDALGVRWKRAPKTRKVATPVVIPDLVLGRVAIEPIWRKPPFVMDCHLAAALAAHSGALADLGVRALRFTAIHDYRKAVLKGRSQGFLSRHALGLAMDVYEIALTDDRVLVIERDYDGGDEATQATLRAIEAAINASGAFRTLLTPGSDRRSHSDHFHFEARMLGEAEQARDPRPQARSRPRPARRSRGSRSRR